MICGRMWWLWPGRKWGLAVDDGRLILGMRFWIFACAAMTVRGLLCRQDTGDTRGEQAGFCATGLNISHRNLYL